MTLALLSDTISRGWDGGESGAVTAKKRSPTAEVGNLLSGEIIIMARNRSMARSDLRLSPGNCLLSLAALLLHILLTRVSSASLKASPPACVRALRACVRACEAVLRARARARAVMASFPSFFSLSFFIAQQPVLEARLWPPCRTRASPGIHTGIYPLAHGNYVTY